MNKNRKIFLIAFAIFMAILIIIMMDIASKTTAPWKKSSQPTENSTQE